MKPSALPDDPPARPTLRDIAQVAGLTKAGVSLALRGHRSIPEATCDRVRSIAEQLGYRPDPELAKLAVHLRQNRPRPAGRVLGLLSLSPASGFASINSFSRRLYDGVARKADALGYRIEEFRLGAPGMTAPRMQTILATRGIKGLLVCGAPAWQETLAFDFGAFTAVTVGHALGTPMHRASQHQYREMFLALRELHAAGYRRPGLMLTTDTDLRTSRHYSAAFTIAAQARPAAARVPPLIADALTPRLFARWFSRHAPDVVLAQSPEAPVVISWIRGAGAPPACNTGFASLDVDTSLHPACSGIVQAYEEVAATAVEMLDAELRAGRNDSRLSPRSILIEGRWQQGTTTRPPPGAELRSGT